MNKKNYSFDLETFRDMLQICPNLSGQKFEDPPFEEDILAFIRELSYPRDIKSISYVKFDTLYQPWRTFGTIINKCLSGKVTGLDQLSSLWLKSFGVSKNNKDMYYPRFTNVIINHFMSKDQSIPRRNKVDWYMGNNDPILTTMRFIRKHETIQKYCAILPDNLTNQAMKESDAYKTYHDFVTGKVIPKPKYVWRLTREKTDQAPTTSPCKRLKATAKVAKSGKKKLSAQGLETFGSSADEGTGVSPGVPDVPTYVSEYEQISWKSSNEDDDDEVSLSKDDDDNDVQTPSHFQSTDDETYDEVTQKDNVKEEELEEEETNKEEEVNELYNDMNVNLEGRDTKMTDALLANVQTTQVIEDTHVIITTVTTEVQHQSSSVSSGFISNMLNLNLDIGIDSILNTESTSMVDVPVTTNVEMPPSFVTTLPPPPIPLIQPLQQTPVPSPTIFPSTSLQNLPTFGSLFKFEDKVKALEYDFLEFKQTNQFAEAVSSIPGIVDTYLSNKMNEAVKAAVQLQSDRLREETQADNEDFINKINENMKKIIKEQVKVQVKHQVSKILLRIEKSVNEQLEAEVLIRSSSEAKTSHAVAANLSELELKKILIDKIENNKSINISRRRARKEPESISAPKEKTSKSTGKSKEGYKSHQKATGKSAQVEEPIHADEDLEEPAYQEEFARDVYSRNRIIGIKKLTIVEWRNYKHLEWITVCRDDDKLYTFKEGNYNRLRLQDIEDMLLLLVQGKLTNLNIKERLALGVSLRMFTRSIIIRRRVEDLQLGIKSYQKKLNLTKPDTYRSDLK
ncbi:hypothetical protein Tco_0684866 [Tanacetum coccineum]